VIQVESIEAANLKLRRDRSPENGSEFSSLDFQCVFGSQTTIRYGLARKSHVTMTIYSATGKLVRNLKDESQAAGHILSSGTAKMIIVGQSGAVFTIAGCRPRGSRRRGR